MKASLQDLHARGLLWQAEPVFKDSAQVVKFNRGAVDHSFGSTGAALMKEQSTEGERAEGAVSKEGKAVPFGIHEIDRLLPDGGLLRGAIHEFTLYFIEDFPPPSFQMLDQGSALSFPPNGLLLQIVKNSIIKSERRHVVWIGRGVWPAADLLRQNFDNFSDFIFVDATSPKESFWMLTMALRSHAVAAVVAQADTLSLALTKKLSLAAEQGGVLGLIVRSSQTSSSAAKSRWILSQVVSSSENPCWCLKLRKYRGMQLHTDSWLIELVFDGQKHQLIYSDLNRDMSSKYSTNDSLNLGVVAG